MGATRDNARNAVWISGASSPIGLAIAETIASLGYATILQCHSHPEPVHALCARIQEDYGVASVCHQNDLRDEPAIAAALEQTLKENNWLLYGFVHNAGINKNGLLVRTKIEDVQQMLDINLRAAYAMSALAIKTMIRQPKSTSGEPAAGRIVFLGSTAGSAGNAGQAGYAMTKAGLGGLARSIAREYASRAITCNVVEPGWVETPMSQEVLSKNKHVILESIPMGRLARPDEIASAVAYFISESSSYITGQTLAVNGGLYM